MIWSIRQVERMYTLPCAFASVFRDAVVEAYNQGDLVWIHGFQLLLLPAFVSRRLAAARIGVFLHTPFPSAEIYVTLPLRKEILRGVLAANLVGFQIYDYVRHFMNSCSRVLRRASPLRRMRACVTFRSVSRSAYRTS